MIREILCIYGGMKLSKEFRFFTYLLESYAQHKNTTAGAVLKTLDEKGLTDFVYKMYDLYHVEAIENAYMDLDSLIATGKPAWRYSEERTNPFLFLFSIHPMHLRCHIKHALRQLDAQARALVDEFIQELQHKIVRVARL